MPLERLYSFFKALKISKAMPDDIFGQNGEFFSASNVVFDVGAHHGNVTKRLRKISPLAHIHAFEPFLSSFEILSKNFRNDPNVTLNNVAVSNFKGNARFYSNIYDETNSLLQSSLVDDRIDSFTKNVTALDVPTVTLDWYVEEKNIHKIDFLKVDVQGNTFEVLEGSKNLLERKLIKWIYAECEFTEIYKNEKLFSEIELLMRRFGYELVKFYNPNYTQNSNLAWVDALFREKLKK